MVAKCHRGIHRPTAHTTKDWPQERRRPQIIFSGLPPTSIPCPFPLLTFIPSHILPTNTLLGLQTPRKQPTLTQRKPEVSTPTHAPPSASTFRLHLAEVTGIVVEERATERARAPRTAVMRQIGLFAPPDPLR